MDLQELSKLLKTQLAHLLISIPESKDLVLDAELTKPLDRVAGITFLKEHGVDKIFKLEGQKSLPGCSKRIYLVHPRMVTMKYIADQIKTEMSLGEHRTYKIVMVPRKIHSCEKILESEGVMGHVTLDEFSLELFPLDADLLSLEQPGFFNSFYLDGDTTGLHTVASSLVNLQRLYGKIPNVYTIGRGAKMTYDLMQSMLDTPKERKDTKYHIGQLFIIDRDVDYVTPLCSSVTYEALLNETFGIECCMIDFDSEVTGETKNTKLLLTGQDEIYSQIRDRHFTHVFSFLAGKAKELQALHDKKNNLKTVGDMKEYVGNELRVLKHQQKLLTTHIGACEVIMKTKKKMDFEEFMGTEHSLLDGSDIKECIAYIESCLQKQFSPSLTLKLLSLLSLTQEGLSANVYKSLKTQFLHSHGFEHLVTFFNFKKLGLLTEQEVTQMGGKISRPAAGTAAKSNFKSISRKLNLVPKQGEEVDLKSPTDMSYIFSGAYTPLACKLVEQILTRDTLIGLDETCRLCGGLFSDVKIKRATPPGKSALSANPSMNVAVVYFLGGCTYSEISALRFITRQTGIRIIVATTAIMTGQSLLDGLTENPVR